MLSKYNAISTHFDAYAWSAMAMLIFQSWNIKGLKNTIDDIEHFSSNILLDSGCHIVSLQEFSNDTSYVSHKLGNYRCDVMPGV